MDTTISAATRLADGHVLPPFADGAAAAGAATSAPLSASAAEFSKALASATSAASATSTTSASAPVAAPSWLTGPDQAQAAKPHISDFMKRTGVDFLTASELLYGVVGSNVERRDWATIMAQGDPVTAARQATRALYGDTSQPPRTDARYLDEASTLARKGNFALTEERFRKGAPAVQDVKLVDAQGLMLRSAGQDAATMARNAWLFGFDMADAQALIPAAQASAPRLAAELQTAVEGRAALAFTAPEVVPSVAVAAAGVPALGVPSAPVLSSGAAASLTAPAAAATAASALGAQNKPLETTALAMEAAPALTAVALQPEAAAPSQQGFSTADVMRWRQVAAEAGNALASNALEELLALR